SGHAGPMLLATLLLFAAAEPPQARVAAELERSERAFAQNDSKDEQWLQLRPRIQTVLDRARRALAAKQLWAALEDLGKIRGVLDPSLAVKASEGRDLEAFQARVIAAFQPPRSIDQHSDFIAINAQLKLARELDSGGLPAGALYTWLDAVQQFGALEAQDPGEAMRARLREQLAKARAELDAA